MSSAVDLALVFAMDCSSSVDAGDYVLQMKGLAAALRSPEVAAAIASGGHRAVALSLMHWGDKRQQEIVMPFRRIVSPADLESMAQEIERSPRHIDRGSTALGTAIDRAVMELRLALPYQAGRLVIDISGDGENNDGPHPSPARDRAIAYGITINGLPILSGGQRRLVAYYKHSVIGGADAFLVEAASSLDFRRAMTEKLVHEINRTVA